MESKHSYDCDLCGMVFPRLDSFNRHKLSQAHQKNLRRTLENKERQKISTDLSSGEDSDEETIQGNTGGSSEELESDVADQERQASLEMEELSLDALNVLNSALRTAFTGSLKFSRKQFIDFVKGLDPEDEKIQISDTEMSLSEGKGSSDSDVSQDNEIGEHGSGTDDSGSDVSEEDETEEQTKSSDSEERIKKYYVKQARKGDCHISTDEDQALQSDTSNSSPPQKKLKRRRKPKLFQEENDTTDEEFEDREHLRQYATVDFQLNDPHIKYLLHSVELALSESINLDKDFLISTASRLKDTQVRIL